MRRTLTHAPALLLTFSCGLVLTLLWWAFINDSVKRLARSAELRVAAPHVAVAEQRFRERRILFDKRDYWEELDAPHPWGLRDFESLGDRRAEVKRRILPKLFPGGHLEHYGQCSRESRERRAWSEADLAWARENKQFVGYVPAWHDGSFTAPGAWETLYEIDVGECNAREGPLPATRLFAVFDRWDELHASIPALPAGSVLEVRDVDGDDVDEVLLGWSEMRGTTYVSRLRLASLKGGGLRVLHDFGIGYLYSFTHPLGDDRVITIPVIYYTPRGDGETPEFHVDYYRASCRKSEGCGFMPRPSAWRYFKSGSLNEDDRSVFWDLGAGGLWKPEAGAWPQSHFVRR